MKKGIWAVAILVLAALVFAGKIADSRRAHFVQGKLFLPASSQLGMLSTAAFQPLTKFDGQYPSLWPAGFKLPAGSYLSNDAKLSLRPPPNPKVVPAGSKSITFTGVTKSTPEEALAFFRMQFKAANIAISSDKASGPAPVYQPGWIHRLLPTSQMPGDHGLDSKLDKSSKLELMSVLVFLNRDLDGYTFFFGRAIVQAGTN